MVGDLKNKSYLLLNLAFFIYSLTSICSKFTSKQPTLSVGFFIGLGGIFLTMLIYAIIWQQAIKAFELSMAYSLKGVTVIWTLLWAALIFGETIKPSNIIGAFIIIVGVYIMGKSDE